MILCVFVYLTTLQNLTLDFFFHHSHLINRCRFYKIKGFLKLILFSFITTQNLLWNRVFFISVGIFTLIFVFMMMSQKHFHFQTHVFVWFVFQSHSPVKMFKRFDVFVILVKVTCIVIILKFRGSNILPWIHVIYFILTVPCLHYLNEK